LACPCSISSSFIFIFIFLPFDLILLKKGSTFKRNSRRRNKRKNLDNKTNLGSSVLHSQQHNTTYWWLTPPPTNALPRAPAPYKGPQSPSPSAAPLFTSRPIKMATDTDVSSTPTTTAPTDAPTPITSSGHDGASRTSDEAVGWGWGWDWNCNSIPCLFQPGSAGFQGQREDGDPEHRTMGYGFFLGESLYLGLPIMLREVALLTPAD
jgi:hypothetical protein